jgi:hypothetical protein
MKENNEKKTIRAKDLHPQILALFKEGYLSKDIIAKLKEEYPTFPGCRIETISRILRKHGKSQTMSTKSTPRRKIVVKEDGRKTVTDKRKQKKSRLFPHKAEIKRYYEEGWKIGNIVKTINEKYLNDKPLPYSAFHHFIKKNFELIED